MNKCHEIILTHDPRNGVDGDGLQHAKMERRMGPAAQGDTLGRRKELLGCG